MYIAGRSFSGRVEGVDLRRRITHFNGWSGWWKCQDTGELCPLPLLCMSIEPVDRCVVKKPFVQVEARKDQSDPPRYWTTCYLHVPFGEVDEIDGVVIAFMKGRHPGTLLCSMSTDKEATGEYVACTVRDALYALPLHLRFRYHANPRSAYLISSSARLQIVRRKGGKGEIVYGPFVTPQPHEDTGGEPLTVIEELPLYRVLSPFRDPWTSRGPLLMCQHELPEGSPTRLPLHLLAEIVMFIPRPHIAMGG